MWATAEESREEIVGLRADNDNLPPGDRDWWESYRNRLEQVARAAG